MYSNVWSNSANQGGKNKWQFIYLTETARKLEFCHEVTSRTLPLRSHELEIFGRRPWRRQPLCTHIHSLIYTRADCKLCFYCVAGCSENVIESLRRRDYYLGAISQFLNSHCKVTLCSKLCQIFAIYFIPRMTHADSLINRTKYHSLRYYARSLYNIKYTAIVYSFMGNS